MDKLYYTPQEVAGMLEVSVDTVLAKIHRDEIPALRVSARIFRVPVVGLRPVAVRLRPEAAASRDPSGDEAGCHRRG